MHLLLGPPLMMLGLVAGIYLATLVHDVRIADLSAREYVAMHQMRDKTFSRVMPALAMCTLGLVLIGTSVLLVPGWPRLLGAVAAAMLIVDIAIAVKRQVPINQAVQRWTAETIPGDWAEARNQWARHHNIRLMLALAAYACFTGAVLGTVAP